MCTKCQLWIRLEIIWTKVRTHSDFHCNQFIASMAYALSPLVFQQENGFLNMFCSEAGNLTFTSCGLWLSSTVKAVGNCCILQTVTEYMYNISSKWTYGDDSDELACRGGTSLTLLTLYFTGCYQGSGDYALWNCFVLSFRNDILSCPSRCLHTFLPVPNRNTERKLWEFQQNFGMQYSDPIRGQGKKTLLALHT